ncbi:hypothetical protein ACSFBF_31135 [Variovorax sp. ZT5P49]|uniref:hypothetical protein n=1 Tax=Variovorax sp. ZT5P49 TaxID=3443733 RepID=UPI003F4518D7
MTPQRRSTDDTLSRVGRWLLAIAVVALASLILWMAGCGDRLSAYGMNDAIHIGESIT